MSTEERGTKPWPRSVRWSLEALVLVLALGVVNAWQTRALPTGPVPALSLRSLSGETFTESALAGSPSVLVFWAPWCGVCRAESQNLSWLHGLVGARAKVISVAVQYGQLREVEDYVQAQGVDYPVLLGGRQTARRFDVHAYPTLFFLDAQGAIKHASVGYTTMFGLLWRTFL